MLVHNDTGRDEAFTEIMNRAGIPLDAEPIEELQNASGVQYVFEVDDQTWLVTEQTMDRNHGPHWEAGQPKANLQVNDYGHYRIDNSSKIKVNSHSTFARRNLVSEPNVESDAFARWQDFLSELNIRGVGSDEVVWLDDKEATHVESTWRARGYERYGLIALIPPSEARVRRGDFPDGQLPPWLDTSDRARNVLLTFSGKQRAYARMAATTYGFAIDHVSAFARADREGVGVVTADLSEVLLVNVEDDRLGDSRLDFDAWGEFLEY